MSVQEKQTKHMEIVHRMGNLDIAVQELWNLVYKVNPGLASPKTDVEQELEQQRLTLSEFFSILPERISTIVGSIREATETMEKELY